jgi:polar amino acid transport system permease protein/octopine/nopaline transport system permease protein
LIAAGILYFTVVFILTRIMNWVERRMSSSRASMV